MINTHPSYVRAEGLSKKELWRVVIDNGTLCFDSKWQWIRTMMFLWGIPLVVAGAFLGLFFAYKYVESGETIDWIMIIGAIATPAIVMLPVILVATFYMNYLRPKRVMKNIRLFIQKYIPDATDMKGITATNFILRHEGLEYEVAYSEYVYDVNNKGRGLRRRPCFFVCLYYAPNSGNALFDQNGAMTEAFVEHFYEYCRGKESCRYLIPDNNMIWGTFEKHVIEANAEIVRRTMGEMSYVLQRFELFPLYLCQKDVKVQNGKVC